MEHRLKERLIGAAVLVMLAVILIPMVLDNSVETDTSITKANIPPRPENGFSSRIIPLEEAELTTKVIPRKMDDVTTDIITPEDAGESRTGIELSNSQPAAVKVPVIAAVTPDKEPVGLTAWVVQLGSFTSEEN